MCRWCGENCGCAGEQQCAERVVRIVGVQESVAGVQLVLVQWTHAQIKVCKLVQRVAVLLHLQLTRGVHCAVYCW